MHHNETVTNSLHLQAENGYKVELHIFKDAHKNVIGKKGATISKVTVFELLWEPIRHL